MKKRYEDLTFADDFMFCRSFAFLAHELPGFAYAKPALLSVAIHGS